MIPPARHVQAGAPQTAPIIDLAAERQRRRGSPTVDRWVTKAEMAHELGRTVQWIDCRVAQGLPCVRVGRLLRFQPSVVADWLEHHGPDAR